AAHHLSSLLDSLGQDLGPVREGDLGGIHFFHGGWFLAAGREEQRQKQAYHKGNSAHSLRIVTALGSFLKRLRLTLEMIKFEHSVFALPFALTGALLAWREQGFHARSASVKLAWIVI